MNIFTNYPNFFIVLDVLAFIFWEIEGGYSFFVTIGGIFVEIFLLSSYFGILLPGYLRIKEKTHASNVTDEFQVIEEDPLQNKINEIHNRSLHLKCPTCNALKVVTLKGELVYSIKIQRKPIMSITILENIVCPHRFQIYLDKELNIRGYSPIDYF